MSTDQQILDLWTKAGGAFHGPKVETGYMEQSKLIPFLRGLVQRAERAERNEAVCHCGELVSRHDWGDGHAPVQQPFECPTERERDALRLEVSKVQAVMLNGADDARWPPGTTAVDALIRELEKTKKDLNEAQTYRKEGHDQALLDLMGAERLLHEVRRGLDNVLPLASVIDLFMERKHRSEAAGGVRLLLGGKPYVYGENKSVDNFVESIAAGRVKPMPPEKYQAISVGDMVRYAEGCGHHLRSGGSMYSHAVVLSLSPMVLISPQGDMLWSSTVAEDKLVRIGVSEDAGIIQRMKREHEKEKAELRRTYQRLEDSCVGWMEKAKTSGCTCTGPSAEPGCKWHNKMYDLAKEAESSKAKANEIEEKLPDGVCEDGHPLIRFWTQHDGGHDRSCPLCVARRLLHDYPKGQDNGSWIRRKDEILSINKCPDL